MALKNDFLHNLQYRRWHTGFGFSEEDQDEFLAWLQRWMVTRTTAVEEVVGRSQAPALGITESTKADSVTLEQGPGVSVPGSGSTVTGSERVVKEQTTVIRSAQPDAAVEKNVEEMMDESGFSKTTTMTTVTRTERIEGETLVPSGGMQQASTTKTTVLESRGQEGLTFGEVTPGEGQTVTRTTVSTISAAPGGEMSAATEFGAEVSPRQGMTQTETRTKVISSTAGSGQDATVDEAGEGSFGYGMSSSSQTTTTTKTESFPGDFGSSGSGGYFEKTTTTTVTGGDAGSLGSGFSETSTTTQTSGTRSLVAGSGEELRSAATSEVAQSMEEGSYGSGYSETKSHRVQEVFKSSRNGFENELILL